MLVFAVAVVVAENIVGGVGLIASDAEGYSYVAVLSAHEAIKGAEFVVIIGHALGELCGFGADGSGWLDSVFLQIPIPATYIFPAVEAADLDVWWGKTAERGLCLFFQVGRSFFGSL